MTALSLMESRFWLTAGWTMVHFLWAGTALGLATLLIRQLCRTARPQVRYALALGCFAVLALTPLALLPWALPQMESPHYPSVEVIGDASLPVLSAAEAPSDSPPAEPSFAPLDGPSPPLPEPASPPVLPVLDTIVSWLPWIWLIGAPLTFGLVATGLVGSTRLRQKCWLLSQGPIVALGRRLAADLKMARVVGIAVCPHAVGPLLLGILRPLILLPPAAITGWTPQQLEMVLLHELAHVRRHDNLVNLLQRLVEALLFFHPVVWWVSAWVRLERECCCDQVVLDHGTPPRAYAEVLAHLAHVGSRSTGVAMSRGSLAFRIRRILQVEDRSMKVSRTALAVVVVLLFMPVIFLGAAADDRPTSADLVQQAPPTPEAAPPTERTPAAPPPPASSGPLSPGMMGMPAPKPPQVEVIRPVERMVTDHLYFTGRTEPAASVEIRSRVTGTLIQVDFQDGALVKKGELLFEIDPRVFQVELERAEAELMRAEAQAKLKEADVQRAKKLVTSGGVSPEELDRTQAAQVDAVAALRVARASRNLARLNLEATKITAPIRGRIGRHLLDVGSLVTAGTTVLAKIVADDPLAVSFDVDENSFLRLRKLSNEGKFKESGITVRVSVAGEKDFSHSGKLDFTDNQVDPATGTIRLRGAAIPNADHVLMPGMFAGVRVESSAPFKALLIPDAALGTNQGQKFVCLVDGQNKVVYRRVMIGGVYDRLRAIKEGLQPGEQVIIGGLQKVQPGLTVRPKEVVSSPAPTR